MASRTDYQCLVALDKKYTPAQRGILSQEEAELIKKELELNSRTIIELNNIRDMSVMFFTIQANSSEQDIPSRTMECLDKMSAVTHVIDMALLNRGKK